MQKRAICQLLKSLLEEAIKISHNMQCHAIDITYYVVG